MGTEFVPETDDGRTSFRLTTPVGSSLAYTDAKARQVEQLVQKYPEVEGYQADVLVLPDLERFVPDVVLKAGKPVAPSWKNKSVGMSGRRHADSSRHR